jgi:5-methylcytosine-specific restriction endonuclease McrA
MRFEANRERSRIRAKAKGPRPSISCKVSFISCYECGSIFSARMSIAKHCSAACSYAAGKDERLAVLRDRYVRREPTKQACSQCSEPFMASHGARYCEPCADWNKAEARRDYSHRRRAILRNAEQERIRSRLVYERDAWMCGICHDPVDRMHEYPHLMSASLDHMIPLAKGGTHTMQNVQLAHFLCNAKKGDRTGGVESLTHHAASDSAG